MHSILRSRSETEDAVSDVFLRVWLVRIAWNVALDRKRRIRPDQMDESSVQALVARDLPADEAQAEARRMQTVLAEIDRLPKAERQVLLLSAVDELGTPAMAELLGRSESATRALLFPARIRLKDRLAKGGHQ